MPIATGILSTASNMRAVGLSITAGLIPRSLLRKELFPDLLESLIPEYFYRESRWRNPNWPPIKTFGRGNTFGINSHHCVLIPRHSPSAQTFTEQGSFRRFENSRNIAPPLPVFGIETF